MFPLLLSGLVAMTVIVERFYTFREVYATSTGWLSEFFARMQSHRLKEAEEWCQQSDTPISSVLLAGLEHFDGDLEEMELCMKNRAESWVPLIEKRVDVLDTVITAAPLMGLLGTITGMMNSFQVLSEKGMNDPNAITGGVAEALIATATGLIIALLSLVAYNFLTNRVKVFIYDIESAASRLVEVRFLIHRRHRQN